MRLEKLIFKLHSIISLFL
ncbi:UNVERIFIED_CONTAM: hypothetical protein GTU68_020074 [Idotea baltica]|nr:hypothetical protein [Idotea baltica]